MAAQALAAHERPRTALVRPHALGVAVVRHTDVSALLRRRSPRSTATTSWSRAASPRRACWRWRPRAADLAHTDPEVYGPDVAFDFAAERPPSLGFGGGPHHSLGTVMARTEMQEALPVPAAGAGITGPERLHLAFTPAG